jgi:hypothetical protein
VTHELESSVGVRLAALLRDLHGGGESGDSTPEDCDVVVGDLRHLEELPLLVGRREANRPNPTRQKGVLAQRTHSM